MSRRWHPAGPGGFGLIPPWISPLKGHLGPRPRNPTQRPNARGEKWSPGDGVGQRPRLHKRLQLPGSAAAAQRRRGVALKGHVTRHWSCPHGGSQLAPPRGGIKPGAALEGTGESKGRAAGSLVMRVPLETRPLRPPPWRRSLGWEMCLAAGDGLRLKAPTCMHSWSLPGARVAGGGVGSTEPPEDLVWGLFGSR